MSFLKGQKVVCIDDTFPNWAKALYDEFPVKDKTYTVRDIGIGLDVKGSVKSDKSYQFIGEADVTVWLVELKNPENPSNKLEHGFNAKRFVPLEELTEEEIESIVAVHELIEEIPEEVETEVEEFAPCGAPETEEFDQY